jgi:DNA-binding HxlR family transcriptional regulator
MSQLSDMLKSINLVELIEILTALANEDALKIFLTARTGIEKSTQTIQELGLTQKRYYSRLKDLIEAGLIEKREYAYRHTTTGTICYTLGKSLNSALGQRDRLELADMVRRSKSISPEVTKQILQVISPRDLINSFEIGESIHPARMIEEQESLVSELVNRIESAEERIYLAAYDPNVRVMEALIKAAQRKIDMSLLTGKSQKLSERIQILRMILNPGIAHVVLDLLQAQELKVKHGDVPFNFCVIDETFALIELSDPFTKGFQVGFALESLDVCQKLGKTFDSLFQKAEVDPLVTILKKRGSTSSVVK